MSLRQVSEYIQLSETTSSRQVSEYTELSVSTPLTQMSEQLLQCVREF